MVVYAVLEDDKKARQDDLVSAFLKTVRNLELDEKKATGILRQLAEDDDNSWVVEQVDRLEHEGRSAIAELVYLANEVFPDRIVRNSTR